MKLKGNILIVDDEVNIREGLKISLIRAGNNVFTAQDGLEALKVMDDEEIDVVITDLLMPNMDGNALLKKILADYFNVPVIILTGHATIENAVELMRKGAYDFITKPLNLEKLNLIVERAISKRELIIENRDLQSKLKTTEAGKIIGKSDKMIKILEKIQQIAPTKTSVLILGENGSGKEVIANFINDFSNRKDKPFIKVHCAALSESLLESELFGHEKGAFTGAIKTKKGRFELADGGTIFLDEIGEISLNIQVKLLRIIQERKFERVGGEETISSDVRIISATNLDLKKQIEDGKFREDLYYRLNVIQIEVPPLRSRREDIPLFISNFISEFSKENNKVINDITNKAKISLINYNWPGNVRELRNVLEASVVLSKKEVIDIDDLPPYIANSGESENYLKIDIPEKLSEIEKKVIINTLKITNGNKSKAALLLGITRKTLLNKINDYRIILNNSEID